MTTTASALAAGSGIIQIVAAIEGYDYLLTDGDTSRAVTAWSGSGWTQALGGLFVDWKLTDSIKPWDESADVSTCTLTVVDTSGADTFGIDVHGNGRGNSTKLQTALGAATTTISVLNTSALSSPVWIGPERITYSGSTATSLTGCTRGTLAPFKAGSAPANQCGRNHSIPDANNNRSVQVPPVVATKPRVWVGRRIGVWLHVSTDGGSTLNTKAEAQLLFAGRVQSIRDASNNTTILECVDIKQDLLDAVMLRDQYVGKVQEGIILIAGQTFQASESTQKSSTLTVVNAAPANSYQVQQGIYTLTELAAVLNKWFGQAKTDLSLSFNWQWIPIAQDSSGNTRSQFTWFYATGGTFNDATFTGPSYVLQFMGLGVNASFIAAWAGTSLSIYSPEEPYRILPTVAGGGNYLYVDHTSGTIFDNTAWLPSVVQPLSGSGWALLKLSTGDVALAQPSGTYTLSSGKTVDLFLLQPAPQLSGLGNSAIDSLVASGVRASQGEVQIDCVQMAVFEGTFADLLTRMLVSTGVGAYNDAAGFSVSYDTLVQQMGAAIPAELLDAPWEKSIKAVDAGLAARGLLVVLDKPTKLWDLIKTELIARRASIIWSQTGGTNGTGGLAVTTWSTPTATTAVWNFTEANKAVDVAVQDPQVMPTEVTDEYAVPLVKLSYNRLPDGTYRGTLTVVDAPALDDTGNASRILTLEMRNSYGGSGFQASGSNVEILASQIAGWLPLLSRPLRKMKRTVGPQFLCQLNAGDQCTVNDNFARDPSTGVRGLSGKPGLILSKTFDLGGPSPTPGNSIRGFTGEVEILLLPTDRIAVYSPAAEIDWTSTNSGYVVATKTITAKAHSFSLSSEAADATRFAAGDKVRVVEQDPVSGGSPTTWTDTVASQSGNTIVLTTGLTAPAWDTTKRYYVVADHYAADTATQKSKVFQADDATNLIESVADAYQYGYGAGLVYQLPALVDSSVPPPLYTTYDYGNGYPLTPSQERDAIARLNNLVQYRTAPIMPMGLMTALQAPTTGLRGILGMPFMIFVGLGLYPGSYTRKLFLSPFARNTSTTSKTLIVTLSRFPPQGNSSTLTSTTNPEYTFSGPRVSYTWTLAGSAGWGALSTQQLDARVCDQLTEGIGWITVEASGDGTGRVEFRGFADSHLGPLVAA